MATRTAPVPEVDEPMGLPRKMLRALAVVVALVLVLFWVWIFSGGPRKVNPDRLDDRAYVARIETRCQRLLTDLTELPPAAKSATARERADVLDQANVMVAAMVTDIEAGAPAEGDDRDRLKGWFKDWHAYLGDREDFATRLRDNSNAQLLVSENKELHDSVDKTIEVFADVNDIPDCATPGDVG